MNIQGPLNIRHPQDGDENDELTIGFKPFEKIEERRSIKKDAKGSGSLKKGIEENEEETITFEDVYAKEVEAVKEREPRKQSLFDISLNQAMQKPGTEKAGLIEKKLEPSEKLPQGLPLTSGFPRISHEDEKKSTSPFSLVSEVKKSPQKENEEPAVPPIESLDIQRPVKPVETSSQIETPPQPPPLNLSDKIKKIEEIVEQIVTNLYTKEEGDKTTTVIELKHPPLFHGAVVSLTEQASAKGEFNITFENLRPEAKALLDEKNAKDALQMSLKAEGIIVHMIVASTEPPAIIPGKPGEKERDARGEERNFGDTKKEKNQKK